MLQPESQLLEQEPMPEVPVNGKVLEWARAIRGLNIDNAAELLNIPPEELRDYESGTRKPLVGLLRLMSAKYQINFTSLLMPEPLPIPKSPEDHRERYGKRPLSIDSIVAIEEVTEALDVFADIAGEMKNIVPALRIGRAELTDDPEAIAARERRRFNVSIEEQQSWRGLADARRQWRKRVEALGVFTYMIPMPIEELSGFSIYRDEVAAICINDNEPTEGAKIFTLMHEYCHLLLRHTGISDENNTNRIERFCNEFAASFLLPKSALVQEIGQISIPYEFSDGQVKQFATRFRVSNRAVALRLQETGLAPSGFYGRRTAPWDLPTPRPQITSDKQPTYITLRLKRIGKLHARTVLRAEQRRLINSFDASELIGLQRSHFPKLMAALG